MENISEMDGTNFSAIHIIEISDAVQHIIYAYLQ